MNKFLCALLTLALAPVVAEVKVGDPAPTIRLKDQEGVVRDIGTNYGRHYVALAFYPKDDTPGCTLEAQSINNALEDLSKAGIVVYGVSVQDVATKKAFVDKHGLKQPMLSDEDKSVAEAYGTLNDKGVSARVTFILDPSLTIREIDRDVKVTNHAKEIQEAVGRLREEDAKAMATLAEQPLATDLGFSLRVPQGWTLAAREAGQPWQWSFTAADGAALQLAARQVPGELSKEIVTPEGARVRLVQDVSVAGQQAVRADYYLDGNPATYVTSLYWGGDGHFKSMKLVAPAERASEAARLLAAIAATVTS
ncbi:MAG: peroxiredoxin [Armatimonadetes bacterium]|nr:peroxiredoxin [Armatimonadota bacterium]